MLRCIARPPQVEPAVTDPQRLVDASPRRAGTAAASSGDRIVSCLTCTSISPVDMFGLTVSGARCDDLTLGLHDELVPQLVRGRRSLGRALRVDHELELPVVVAQVDEDETAVVAARGTQPATVTARRSSLGRQRTRRSKVAPAHAVSVATTSSRPPTCSSVPVRAASRAPSSRTTTTVCAPLRPACVSWPFNDRPA